MRAYGMSAARTLFYVREARVQVGARLPSDGVGVFLVVRPLFDVSLLQAERDEPCLPPTSSNAARLYHGASRWERCSSGGGKKDIIVQPQALNKEAMRGVESVRAHINTDDYRGFRKERRVFVGLEAKM